LQIVLSKLFFRVGGLIFVTARIPIGSAAWRSLTLSGPRLSGGEKRRLIICVSGAVVAGERRSLTSMIVSPIRIDESPIRVIENKAPWHIRDLSSLVMLARKHRVPFGGDRNW
jgi:hypothetical protein